MMKRLAGLMLTLCLVLAAVMVCFAAEAEGVEAGDVISFGHYPQTAMGDDQTPVEWIVLEVRENRALLISRCLLDMLPYNTNMTGVTWEECTLRTWLNGDFLSSAFDEGEQCAIPVTMVDNSKEQGYDWTRLGPWQVHDGGNNTEDRLFLLSWAEANRYFGIEHWKEAADGGNAAAQAGRTEFAMRKNPQDFGTREAPDGRPVGFWWLRSPGDILTYAELVDISGELSSDSVNAAFVCVRPAMWLDLEAAGF